MSFLERFKKQPELQPEPVVIAPRLEVIQGGSPEERLRFAALKNSAAPRFIRELSQLPEVEILYPNSWHPAVCVMDQSHQGDQPKWNCFDVVGRQDGAIAIGREILGRREATDPELVDEALLRAFENPQKTVFGNPHESAI